MRKSQRGYGIGRKTASACTDAALAGIAGCFAFGRGSDGQAVWWPLPKMTSLTPLAYLLTFVCAEHRGGAYGNRGEKGSSSGIMIFPIASLSKWLEDEGRRRRRA